MKGSKEGMRLVTAAALVLAVMTVNPARAGGDGLRYRPSGFGDLYTGNMVGLDMNFVIGDDVTGYVPALLAQFGAGNMAVGLQWGLAYADVDVPEGYGEYDGEVAPGNFIVNFRAKHHMEGAWETCIGTNFSLGIGPFEMDSLEQALSWTTGIYAHTLRYLHYAPESVLIDPLLALNTTNGTIFLQVALGPSVLVPLDDTDVRDVEACLAYGAELGFVAAEMLSMGLGFKGVSMLTADDNESLFALDINLRLVLDGVSPGFRLSIPFSTEDSLDEAFDLIVTLGVLLDL